MGGFRDYESNCKQPQQMTETQRIETLKAVKANGILLAMVKAMVALLPEPDTTILDEALHIHKLTVEELSKSEVDEDRLNVLIDEMQRFKARIDNLQQ